MTGTVVCSVEIELAWGLAHLDDQTVGRHDERRATETETLERLLALCDDLDVPITFDVVGHLLLDSCPGTHERRDSIDGELPDGWFADDPGTSVETDPLYYAPDLIDRIEAADVDHEIATHTFTHPRCDLVDDAVVDWELEATADAHASSGLAQPRSFVPPMHGPPPIDVLREHGITGVREPVTLRPPVKPRSAPDSRVAAVLDRVRESHPVQVLGRTHPIRDPELRDGIVRHYSTWHASLTAPYLPNGRTPPHSIYRAIPTRVRQRLHERYLREAIDGAVEQDSCAHLWTHLFNASNGAQWAPVQSFLEHLAERRDAGELTVPTMESLSRDVRAVHG